MFKRIEDTLLLAGYIAFLGGFVIADITGDTKWIVGGSFAGLFLGLGGLYFWLEGKK